MKLLLLVLLLLVGCVSTKPAIKPVAQVAPEAFLVVSNRTWINLNGTAIFRATDSEWCILTNAYKNNLSTDSIQFVK